MGLTSYLARAEIHFVSTWKFDAVHTWIVRNLEDVDGRGWYELSQDNIEELKRVVEEVLSCPSLAEMLLPRDTGREYDEHYFDMLRDVQEELAVILEDPQRYWNHWETGTCTIVYSANW